MSENKKYILTEDSVDSVKNGIEQTLSILNGQIDDAYVRYGIKVYPVSDSSDIGQWKVVCRYSISL